MLDYGGSMRAVHAGPLTGLAAQMLLLAAIAATVGLGPAGWIVGATSALAVTVALVRGLVRNASERLGPAGWVTLARATLAIGVAALTGDSFFQTAPVVPLVVLATGALVLDFVDGQVARRTRTETRLGAQMDGEVDAFLILALSVYLAPSLGGWVLAIGLARYAFLAAGWPYSWMRATLPRRDWRKVVAAAQGIVLTVAAAGLLPRPLDRAIVAGALALLAESFGRDVLWLWRHRHDPPERAVVEDRRRARRAATGAGPGRGRLRAALAAALSVLALLVVWLALVAPSQPGRLTPDAFIRLPLEGLVLVALVLLLPRPGRRVLAWVVGPILGVLVLVKLLDIGFFTAFDRPFNPVQDWSYASIGIETLRDTIGRTKANIVVAGVVLVGVAALVVPTLAVLRLTRVAALHRRLSLRAVSGLGAAWVLLWAFGAQLVAGAPVASMGAARLAMFEVRAVEAGLHDHARFAAEIRRDRYRSRPGSRLLSALRGKDVLLIFLESYGKFAVEGSPVSPQVDSLLARGTQQLNAAGFSARSGWLDSPTFGGISWLAHSTLQAGVWVDSNDRYGQLMASRRFTLSKAFRRAGWRVIDDVPSNDRGWSGGYSFYRYQKVYDRRNVGYRGPTYAFAAMPDQYLYLSLQRLELARRDRRPLFAEVDTVSSHEPWTRIPPLIPWRKVGDGSIFNRLPVDESGVGDSTRGYGRSIVYSLRTLFSFITHYGRKNLVVVMLGDHQPAHFVSGFGVDHEVPISVIAHDPKVLRRISSWGWSPGMRPAAQGPVWRMSSFRDRFLRAYGPQPARR